jgi:hypothetical protein
MGGLVGRPSFAYFSWPARKVGRLPGATGKVFVGQRTGSSQSFFKIFRRMQQKQTKGLRPLATPYSFCAPEKE